MNSIKKNQLLQSLENQYGIYLNIRQITPYLDKESALNNNIPIDFVKHWNEISHWINESFIIAICSVLASYKFYDDKDTKIFEYNLAVDVKEKWDLIRDIRNFLCHNKRNIEHRDLKNRMISLLKLSKEDFKAGIPLPINKVVEKLYKAVIEVVNAGQIN